MLDAREVSIRQPKKTRKTPIESPAIRFLKTRLSPKPLLLLISLRPRPPRKTNKVVGEAMEVIQPLGLMPPR